MKLLTLDPSSTCTGYAVMAAPTSAGLVDAGLIRPTPQSAPVLQRALSMIRDVGELLIEFAPETVVMEIPAKRPPRGMRSKATIGQANYGLAVGWMVSELQHVRDDGGFAELVIVRADEWTGTEKDKRAQIVATMFQQYHPTRDEGMDAADAIGLGLWWFARTSGGRR